MRVSNHELGTLIEADEFVAFFGNRNAQVDNLKKAFTTFEFKRIHQVHGDAITETTMNSLDFSAKADAHWTKEKNIALCISTADCTPVLIHGDGMVAGIHAGWRGVENRIIPKTIEHLKMNGFTALIGPHIQKHSFEVEDAIRDQLLKSSKNSQEVFWQKSMEGKSFVDLHEIVKAQLNEFKVSTWEEIKDTKTDFNYHSFRRDKELSGRQQSFILLKQ